MNGLREISGLEMQNHLYPFFWLHGEEDETLKTYMEKIAESGMKGVCLEARPHPEFLQAGWWSDLDIIIEKAKELDMKIWILDDSHFPTGFANGKIKDCYPEYKKWYLNMRRYDVQGPMTQARIDLKLLRGRPWEKPDESAKILGVYLAKRDQDIMASEDPIDASTIADITEQMRMEDQLLTLDVPAGAYSLLVVYQTRKGEEEATKDYLNPLVKEATQVLIDEVYEAHYVHYKEEFGKTIMGFFSDEPRFGNIKGTDASIGKDMPLPWREGLERELGIDSRMLPLLWVNAGGVEKTVRFRYMDVVTELFNRNFTHVIGEWCRRHGVLYIGHNIEDNGAHARLGYGTGHYFRGQQDMDMAGIDVIGTQIVPGMNYHHDAFSTGGSDGEFYHYALAKLASSAAHLDPRKKGRAMCEAFGAYGWNEGLRTMKWIADHLMVRGINYLVPHAFNPKAFPDWDCPPHFYAQGHNPQFRYFPVFCDYVNRIISLFRDGIHPARAGLLYPAELEWAGSFMPVEKPARILTENQISFDIVSRDYLKYAKIKNGGYEINGEFLEVLIIPYGEYMPSDLLPLLDALADSGTKIIFIKEAPVGIVGEGADQAMLESVIRKSKVVSLTALGNVLSEYRAVWTERPQPDLAVGEYIRNGRHFYMLFNENTGTPVETTAALSADGYVYRYDALTDTLYDVEISGKKIFLRLEPYDSAIYVVSSQKLEGKQDVDFREWKEIPVPEKWEVRFADSFTYPEFKEQVPMERLGFIHPCEGYEDKAGTVQFSADIEIMEVAGAVLDLGEAHETAEVFVNNISAGVRLCRPYTFDFGGLVKPGKNQIRIEVTNTLGTAVREPMSHYLVIEPFGVEGPVRLKIKEK